jgi:uncharacterized protein with HEPN domain
MLDAARKAVAFTRGRPRADLDLDEQLALAVVRLLEIIGEAAKQVTQQTRERAPDVPWSQIAGTRDRLIHGYHDVNLDIVWSIVSNDLPGLITKLESLLDSV